MSTAEQNHLLEMIFDNQKCQIAIISKQNQEKWQKYTVNIDTDFGNGSLVFGVFQNQKEMKQFMSLPGNYQIDFSDCTLSLKYLISACQFTKNVEHKIKLKIQELSQIENLRCQVAFLRRKLLGYESRQVSRSVDKRQKNLSGQKKQRQKSVVYEKNSEKVPEKTAKPAENPKKRTPQANTDNSQKRYRRQNKRIEEMIQLQKRRTIKKNYNPESEEQSKQSLQQKHTIKRKPRSTARQPRQDKAENSHESNITKLRQQEEESIQPLQINDIIQQEQKRSEDRKEVGFKIVVEQTIREQPPKESLQSNSEQNKESSSESQKVVNRQESEDISQEQKQSSDKPNLPQNPKQKTLKNKPEQQQHQQQQIIESESEQSKKNYIRKIKLGDKFKIQFKNGDYYLGQLKDQKFHGVGKYVSKINGTYDGQWVDGRADGFGQTIDIEGNRHEGIYRKDLRHGPGKDWYPNGQRYQGQFLNSSKQGFGIYYYNNGDRYEGNWSNDMCEGQGREIYTNGSYYVGTWRQDEKHGEGKLYSSFGVMKQVYQMGRLVASDKNFKPEEV